jgi:hypothetical protein
MNKLSPTARELVESHRQSRVLALADRERMKQNVMLRVATLGATTAVTGTAVGMSKLALIALGVTVVAGAATFSLWELRARTPADLVSPPESSSPIAPEMIEPARVLTSEGAIAPLDEAPAHKGGSEHAKKIGKRPAGVPAAASGPAATPVTAPSDPEPELRVLREAREDLRAGRSESAYRRLDEYGRHHCVGMLTQERKALSAIALCHWQPGPDAQARAAEFLRISPDSPLAKRVRSACEKAKSSQ